MQEQFVPYEITQILIEKGFKEQCLAYYQNQTLIINSLSNYELDKYKLGIPAPLWQQVINWFLEEHKLLITITSCSQESWQFHIQRPGDNLNTMWKEDFYSYNEARKTAIEHTLTLI
jgi:hypothetical protein